MEKKKKKERRTIHNTKSPARVWSNWNAYKLLVREQISITTFPNGLPISTKNEYMHSVSPSMHIFQKYVQKCS